MFAQITAQDAHLWTNHFAVVGMMIAAGTGLLAMTPRFHYLQEYACALFAAAYCAALVAYFSGLPALELVAPGLSDWQIGAAARHEAHAERFIWSAAPAAALALLRLFIRAEKRKTNIIFVSQTAAAVVAVVLAVLTASSGGAIRHALLH